ncbi:1649_t:CDS:2 [Entrophospora sp. SA101]|nr:1649_t:CDS:2 [Entrophospora sp. SA101]
MNKKTNLRRSIKRSHINKNNIYGENNINSKNSIRRTLSTKRKQRRDITEHLVTLSEAHLIVKLCIEQITLRGLTERFIFKPIRIGDSADEIRYLINLAGMRCTLRNCKQIIIPFDYYEGFIKFELEWEFDSKKGLFNQFISYLPKYTQGIIILLFDLFSKVIIYSHINKMSPERLLKSMALSILGDSTKTFDNFHDAYKEWLKCSNACIHLFLAYLREQGYSTNLHPKLCALLENYVEYRIKTIKEKDFMHPLIDASITDDEKNKFLSKKQTHILFKEPDSITLSHQSSVTRNYSINKNNFDESFEEVLPEIVESLNTYRKHHDDLLKHSTVDQKWVELYNKGVNYMSEDALKLFFAYDEHHSSHSKPSESLPTDNQSYQHELIPNSFSKKGIKEDFDDNVDSSDKLSLSSTLGKKTINQCTTTTPSNSIDHIDYSSRSLPQSELKLSNKTTVSFLCVKRRPQSTTSSISYKYESEDWEDWYVIDRVIKLPINGHLIVETIDDIFPYIWIEVNIHPSTENSDKDSILNENFGEWILIEPKSTLMEYENNDWILIKEKHKFLQDLEQQQQEIMREKLLKKQEELDKSRLHGRKTHSRMSSFSIPWVSRKNSLKHHNDVSSNNSMETNDKDNIKTNETISDIENIEKQPQKILNETAVQMYNNDYKNDINNNIDCQSGVIEGDNYYYDEMEGSYSEYDDESDYYNYENGYYYYDENGYYYDENGYYYDENGYYYDENGYYYDENGYYYDENGYYYDDYTGQYYGPNQPTNYYYQQPQPTAMPPGQGPMMFNNPQLSQQQQALIPISKSQELKPKLKLLESSEQIRQREEQEQNNKDGSNNNSNSNSDNQLQPLSKDLQNKTPQMSQQNMMLKPIKRPMKPFGPSLPPNFRRPNTKDDNNNENQSSSPIMKPPRIKKFLTPEQRQKLPRIPRIPNPNIFLHQSQQPPHILNPPYYTPHSGKPIRIPHSNFNPNMPLKGKGKLNLDSDPNNSVNTTLN